MAENNGIHLKVFLTDNHTSEARRFTVDASAVTNFLFMKEKLQTVFPNIRNADFKITWKDKDGDEITIACDEDWITALTENEGTSNVKIFYVTVTQRNQNRIFVDSEIQGPRIICDVCDQLISGFRYKCLQCSDYDLCTGCEHDGHHSEHLMIRVPNNDTCMSRCARKVMHDVARTIKKTAHIASKEAYRASKFASKCHAAAKSATAEQSSKECGPQPCSSNEEEQRCPFGAAGQTINIDDIHALGAMAKRHLGPLLHTIHASATAASQAAEQTVDQSVIMDMIRNAVDGFFGGRMPNANSNSEEQQHPKEKEASATTQTTQAQPTAMDIEQEVLPTASAPGHAPTLERSDKGWTFVATNEAQQKGEAAKETAPNEQPTGPTLVYHENPRIAEGLVQLHEMGFSNGDGLLTKLLERFDGNVAAVVKTVIDMKI